MDTSTWADYLNGASSPASDALDELLRGDDDVCTCGIVVAEVVQGLREGSTRDGIEAGLRDLTFLRAEGIETYLGAATLFRDLRGRGVTIRSTIDCVLAVMAMEAGCYMLTSDRDFEHIARSGIDGLRLWPT